MIQFKKTLAVTAFAAAILCAPLASASDKARAKPAQKHDIFSQIVGDQTGLKKVYDNGDHCQFIIADDAGREALYMTLTNLAEAKPTQRDATLAWDINNKRGGQRQAKTITVTMTKDAQGQSVLTLDRRLGERANNTNAQGRRRAAANAQASRRPSQTARSASGRMAPGGKVVPPPATVD